MAVVVVVVTFFLCLRYFFYLVFAFCTPLQLNHWLSFSLTLSLTRPIYINGYIPYSTLKLHWCHYKCYDVHKYTFSKLWQQTLHSQCYNCSTKWKETERVCLNVNSVWIFEYIQNTHFGKTSTRYQYMNTALNCMIVMVRLCIGISTLHWITLRIVYTDFSKFSIEFNATLFQCDEQVVFRIPKTKVRR